MADIKKIHIASLNETFDIKDEVARNNIPTLVGTTGESSTSVMTQKAVTDELMEDRIWEITDVSLPFPSGSSQRRYINNSNVWAGETVNAVGMVIPVSGGTTYKVVTQNSLNFIYAWLTTNNMDVGDSPDYIDGMSNIATITAGATEYLEVPATATYMYIQRKRSGNSILPQYFGLVKYTKDKIAEIDGITGMVLYGTTGAHTDGAMTQAAVTDALSDLEIVSEKALTIPSPTQAAQLRYIGGDNVWVSQTSNAQGLVMAITGGKRYKLVGNASYAGNYAFLTGNDRTAGDPPQWASGYSAPITLPANGIIYVEAPEGANYLYLKRKTGGNYVTPQYVYQITLLRDVLNNIDENPNESVTEESLIKSAIYKAGNDTEHTPFLKLFHYSDIHAANKAVTGITEALSKYGNYINGVINTGDVCYTLAEGGSVGGTAWWQGTGLAETSMFTLGNHDSMLNHATQYDQEDGDFAIDGEGLAYCHDNYFKAEYISALGYVMPTGYNDSTSPYYKACYWYKDYDEQKVRLIGLDCIHRFDGELNPNTCFNPTDENAWLNAEYTTDRSDITTEGLKKTTAEQELWLVKRLKETLAGSGNSAEGYSVIVCGHYALDDFSGDNETWDDTTHKWTFNQSSSGGRVLNAAGDPTRFHYYYNTEMINDRIYNWRSREDRGYREGGAWVNYDKGSVNNVGNIINAFIEAEGKFVAFLCGHYHSDRLFYPTLFPNILVISVPAAGHLRANGYDCLGMDTKLANYYVFDTQLHLIKIVRIGRKNNRLLIPTNFLVYDYYNRKVISEG